MKEIAILPLGKVNIKTGHSNYFNIYYTWGEDSAYEIYMVSKNPDSPEYRIVRTSGNKPLAKLHEQYPFINDQTGRFLFYGILVDFAIGEKLKNLTNKYGKSILMYTYK